MEFILQLFAEIMEQSRTENEISNLEKEEILQTNEEIVEENFFSVMQFH